jgi:hypothetical protein
VFVGTVEELLEETVRADTGGTAGARGAAVEFLTERNEVNWRVLPSVTDWVGRFWSGDRLLE